MFTKDERDRTFRNWNLQFVWNFRKLMTLTRLPSFNLRTFLICAYCVSFFVLYLMQLLSNIQAWKTEAEVKDRKPCEKKRKTLRRLDRTIKAILCSLF